MNTTPVNLQAHNSLVYLVKCNETPLVFAGDEWSNKATKFCNFFLLGPTDDFKTGVDNEDVQRRHQVY